MADHRKYWDRTLGYRELPVQSIEYPRCSDYWHQVAITLCTNSSSVTARGDQWGKIDEPRTKAQNDCIQSHLPHRAGIHWTLIHSRSFLAFNRTCMLVATCQVVARQTRGILYILRLCRAAPLSTDLCFKVSYPARLRWQVEPIHLPCVDLYSARHRFWSSLVCAAAATALGGRFDFLVRGAAAACHCLPSLILLEPYPIYNDLAMVTPGVLILSEITVQLLWK
ncbi:hypothetical protein BDN67DRAFT_250171 [Paxillus ammoniavirescens]|nr:hypothetical protein BDN67DRAFT_250171 [Paxillus ammoniavirescens]